MHLTLLNLKVAISRDFLENLCVMNRTHPLQLQNNSLLKNKKLILYSQKYRIRTLSLKKSIQCFVIQHGVEQLYKLAL